MFCSKQDWSYLQGGEVEVGVFQMNAENKELYWEGYKAKVKYRRAQLLEWTLFWWLEIYL